MERMETLDLLLCQGFGSLSKKIQCFQRMASDATREETNISHLAMIVNNGLSVFESTTLNWNGKEGVQLNDYEPWIKHYNGHVWLKKLYFARQPEHLQRCNCFVNDNLGMPYENGIMGYSELLLCGLRLDRFVRLFYPEYKPLETKSPHCTELDAKCLQACSLLKSSAIPNRLPPWVWWKWIDDLLEVESKLFQLK